MDEAVTSPLKGLQLDHRTVTSLDAYEKVPGESREREHVLCFLQRDDEKSMFEFITP